LTINAASGLLASGTHGSQPHAHDDDDDDDEKASAVGHQSRFLADRGYALPLYYSRFLLQAAGYSVRVDQDATPFTPLTFVRSLV